MKIRIITIHKIPNFGSVFQAYALSKFLKDNGYDDTEVIDYNPVYFRKQSLRTKIGNLLNYKSYLTRTKKFGNFIQQNIPLTAREFNSCEELQNFNFDADVYIAGGDQLWNVFHDSGNDNAFKLTFTDGKKISYATSMGQTGFSDEQLNQLCEYLKKFSAVSVREASSVKMLASKEIQATHCVDPVFLLKAQEYMPFIKSVMHKKKYLLVYLVTPSELLENTIAFLSRKYDLQVILCSGFSKKCTCDTFLKDLGPDEILSYINHAEIVLSSSFHATAFSLILKKQFFTIPPNKNTNERIFNLLDAYALSERIITEESPLNDALCSVIDYAALKDRNDLLDASIKYLQNILE